MNTEKVIKELKEKYPGKNIVLNDPENITEIICENDHPNGIAIAVIDSSIQHVHNESVETYKILKNGPLKLYVNNVLHILNNGDKFTINPSKIHYAIGDETWIEAKSAPPWQPDDHILVD